MPTSAVTGTHSVKTTSKPKAKAEAPESKKAEKTKVKASLVPDDDNQSGFQRTRNVTNDEGHVVIEELQNKTWVPIEVRPKSDS